MKERERQRERERERERERDRQRERETERERERQREIERDRERDRKRMRERGVRIGLSEFLHLNHLNEAKYFDCKVIKLPYSHCELNHLISLIYGLLCIILE